MRFTFVSFLIAAFVQIANAQQPRFTPPLEGVYGQDFIIVNYVDWVAAGFLDHQCGTKTYDEHQGTDIVLRSFPQMDSGVAVLAVDTGVVIFFHDGEFDREVESDPAKGFGNFIGIKHSGDLFTYYAHLKKNSILVGLNDVVLPGQKIAEVGSSGNSTDAHLHFEMWYDSTQLIDPFMGPCGNAGTYWLDPYPYDDSYNLWESGMLNFVPTLHGLKERPQGTTDFVIGTDTVIAFWNLQYGLLEGDVSRAEWITPAGDLWFSWENGYANDFWYYYYWTFIDMPPIGTEGEWTVKYYVNGEVKKEELFTVSLPTNSIEKETNKVQMFYSNGQVLGVSEKEFGRNSSVGIYDIMGNRLVFEVLQNKRNFSIGFEDAPQGMYFAVLAEGDRAQVTVKFVVR